MLLLTYGFLALGVEIIFDKQGSDRHAKPFIDKIDTLSPPDSIRGNS